MRVIGGRYKGRRLKAPTWEGLRPTSDKLRETLFNILAPRIGGGRVLDAFAGTGAIGIEALSRGAAHVTFVERDPRAVTLIEANLALVGARAGAEADIASAGPARGEKPVIIRAGGADAIARLGGQVFDLIILDPPYADGAVAEALE